MEAIEADVKRVLDELGVAYEAMPMERESVILGGGSRSLKIRVSPEVFRRLLAVEIVSDLAG